MTHQHKWKLAIQGHVFWHQWKADEGLYIAIRAVERLIFLIALIARLFNRALTPGMCSRPFRQRPRRDPRRTGPRPRRDRDVGHFVRDETETETLRVRDETETETFQLPRHWPRRMVKTVKHHKYGSTGLVALCILWCFGILPLVHYVHCAVLLQ